MNTHERTSYKHRGTTSLTPTQIMDQQTYYGYAWTSLNQGMHIFHLVLLHLASYLRLQWFLDQVSNSTGYYSSSIWTKMESIKFCVDKLLFLMHWIFSHGEIALLQAKFLSTLKGGINFIQSNTEGSLTSASKTVTRGSAKTMRICTIWWFTYAFPMPSHILQTGPCTLVRSATRVALPHD